MIIINSLASGIKSFVNEFSFFSPLSRNKTMILYCVYRVS